LPKVFVVVIFGFPIPKRLNYPGKLQIPAISCHVEKKKARNFWEVLLWEITLLGKMECNASWLGLYCQYITQTKWFMLNYHLLP